MFQKTKELKASHQRFFNLLAMLLLFITLPYDTLLFITLPYYSLVKCICMKIENGSF